MKSAGLLLYRITDGNTLEVLIGHMGGPFWAKKHFGGWSVPKGLAEPGEDDLLAVAEREFCEEMGSVPPKGPVYDLGSAKSGNKTIFVFARQGDFDVETHHSNHFEIEWPRGSGTIQSFPEVDKAEWVNTADAHDLLVKYQGVFIDRLIEALQA